MEHHVNVALGDIQHDTQRQTNQSHATGPINDYNDIDEIYNNIDDIEVHVGLPTEFGRRYIDYVLINRHRQNCRDQNINLGNENDRLTAIFMSDERRSTAFLEQRIIGLITDFYSNARARGIVRKFQLVDWYKSLVLSLELLK